MRFARKFGSEGTAPGQFKDPAGIVIMRGLPVVAEAGGSRLQVLSPVGAPLQVMPFGSDVAGLCTDGQNLWVTDASQHCVHVLKVKGAAP